MAYFLLNLLSLYELVKLDSNQLYGGKKNRLFTIISHNFLKINNPVNNIYKKSPMNVGYGVWSKPHK